jgi:outer membrane protein assembly factor BamB
MTRLRQIWSSWSTQQRVLAVGGPVLAIVGAGVAAYLILKRPGDVSNPEVVFHSQEKPKEVVKTVNWPVYGFNDQRTRYLAAKGLNPPFDPHFPWRRQSKSLLEFSPILVGHRLYYIDKLGNFWAIDSNTGRRVWKQDLGSLNASAPVYAKGKLYGVTLSPGQVIALNPKKHGKVLWKHPLPGRSESSPVVYNDKVIVGCESGDVFALDTKTGEIAWTLHTAGPVKGGVALDNGVVFFGNYAGEFFAVDAQNGQVKWQADSVGLSFGRAGSFYSTPAVAYGRVYAGNKDSRIYSYSEDTGEIAWTHSTGSEVYPAPAVADTPGAPPTVFIGSLDHHFYALDAKTGDELWNRDVGGPILGAASVVDRTVYVSVIGPNIGTIGMETKTGKVVFDDGLGEYNPVISDGRRIYLTGANVIRAMVPKEKAAKKGHNKKQGAKGKPRQKGRSKAKSAN